MIYVSFFTEKNIIPCSYCSPPLSPLNSCTPTKSNLYLVNSLAAVVREPDLYRLSNIPCTEPHCLFPLFRLYQRVSSGPRHLFMFHNYANFYGEKRLAPHPTPGWGTTPFQLYATAYSIYSQLPSILQAVPPSAT